MNRYRHAVLIKYHFEPSMFAIMKLKLLCSGWRDGRWWRVFCNRDRWIDEGCGRFRLPVENISSVLFDQSHAVNILPFLNVVSRLQVLCVGKTFYGFTLFRKAGCFIIYYRENNFFCRNTRKTSATLTRSLRWRKRTWPLRRTADLWPPPNSNSSTTLTTWLAGVDRERLAGVDRYRLLVLIMRHYSAW